MDTSSLDNVVKFFIENFGTFVASFLMIVGACRTIFKPATEIVLAIVAMTKTKKDDEFIINVTSNKFYKAFIWLVNYLLSIKLPK
jgi:hypothetical protein